MHDGRCWIALSMKCLLRDLESKLVPLLEDMLESDLERRPYVIVDEPLTKRFVQFARLYRPKTGELCFDVPKLNIWMQPCPNPHIGAAWAIATLTDAFGLPADAELSLTIGGDSLS